VIALIMTATLVYMVPSKITHYTLVPPLQPPDLRLQKGRPEASKNPPPPASAFVLHALCLPLPSRVVFPLTQRTPPAHRIKSSGARRPLPAPLPEIMRACMVHKWLVIFCRIDTTTTS
jgi:hypothetical protein